MATGHQPIASSGLIAKLECTQVGMDSGPTYGGSNVGNAYRATSEVFSAIAVQHSYIANSSSIMGGYERRQEEWDFQADLAEKELKQIDKQILSAEIRLQMAEKEKQNHEQQLRQTEEVDYFLKSKFTNAQLYEWMSSNISALYYQTYRMALDLARKAEAAFKYELRPTGNEVSYIAGGQWDSMKKGLLAGERLALDLRRLDASYMEANNREYELTKHISLRRLNPLALLQLKTNGTCELTIPEWLFDMDAPGHYMRRIKNVSLSIPAVTGAYTNINCTLSLQYSTIRRSEISDQYSRNPENDDRFIDYYGMTQSIVTSHAQNDSGLFETNLRDERFLPFEGYGAISSWKLELPTNYKQFDYSTISDVILHMRYTARQGIPVNSVISALDTQLEGGVGEQLFFLKNDFSSEWHRFVNSNDTSGFSIELRPEHFPYFTQGRDISISNGSYGIRVEGNKLNYELDLSGSGSEHRLPHTLSLSELTREMDNPALLVSYTLKKQE